MPNVSKIFLMELDEHLPNDLRCVVKYVSFIPELSPSMKLLLLIFLDSAIHIALLLLITEWHEIICHILLTIEMNAETGTTRLLARKFIYILK